MSDKELEIVIQPNGDLEMTTHGIKGKRCLDWARLVESLVGKLRSLEHTPEYYEPEVEAELDLEADLEQKLRR